METAPLCGDYNNYSSSHSVLSKDKKMFMQDLFTHANTNVRTQTTEQYNKYNQTFFFFQKSDLLIYTIKQISTATMHVSSFIQNDTQI